MKTPKLKIVIVGAGPAGSSLAIRLTKHGFRTILVERDKFPRHKLCGEFISPECLEHFRELGILDKMLEVGGDRITETVFYAKNGKSVTVPSEWFGNSQDALGISRAEMDFRLLEKARETGTEVFEETQVVGLLFENEQVSGVKVKDKNGETREIAADLTIDATGRANVLAKFADKFRDRRSELGKIQAPKSQIRNRLVGFKAHLKNVHLAKGRCEIYSFRGGYGGLNFVENNRANHCFLIKAGAVKEFSGDADRILREIIFQNRRAREMMKDAVPVFEWLAVSVDSFGAKNLNPAKRLLAIGDAAAFIDPFTGSGMLMALESSEILARLIIEKHHLIKEIEHSYAPLYRQKFQRRLRVCSLIRRAAYAPNFAKLLISALSLSNPARETLARATRQSSLVYKNK